jgi:DNA-binding GntR family transcriptional regulator
MLIFDGLLSAGSRIPQDELAAELGISRMPIREALIALEREGWVIIEMHRGAFVSPVNEEILRDHYQMLGLVFGFALRRAIERDDGTLFDRLAELRSRLAGEPDPEQAGDLLRRFHGVILEQASSPPIRVLLRSIPSQIPTDIFSTVPAVVDIQRPLVALITEAVRDKAHAPGAAAYLEMMEEAGREVSRLFRRRNLLGPPTADQAADPADDPAVARRAYMI